MRKGDEINKAFKRDLVQDVILTEETGAVEEKLNLSLNLSSSEENNGELNYSGNNDSKPDNGSSSDGSKTSEINSSPGFDLLGSLACLYVGWKLRKM